MFCVFFFLKQKTAYEMRISDWSSDVCSSDLGLRRQRRNLAAREFLHGLTQLVDVFAKREVETDAVHICTRSDAAGNIAATGMREPTGPRRSEERRVGKECGSTVRSRWAQYP